MLTRTNNHLVVSTLPLKGVGGSSSFPSVSRDCARGTCFGQAKDRSLKVNMSLPKSTWRNLLGLIVAWQAVSSRLPNNFLTSTPAEKRESPQLFSGTNYFSRFFGGCPTKNGLPQKGIPFIPRVTEQLSHAYWPSTLSGSLGLWDKTNRTILMRTQPLGPSV